MTKRAALIITDGVIVDGVTLRNRDSIIEDLDGVVEHLWLETSEQLLADLRLTVHLAETRLLWNEESNLSPKTYADWTERVARVRALLPKEEEA